jgi:hypothetical protein
VSRREWLLAIALGLAIALAVTGCTPAPAEPDEFAEAFDLCVWAHNDETYEGEDTEGNTVWHTPETGCMQWLETVGEAEFIEQWDSEFAALYRAAFS